ncbi:MAG: DNA polymerase I [Geminicoccaceae bacterium]
MIKKAPELVLIAGSGYIFRAFFALPPMTRADGTPVNAVYGFCNMLWRLMQDLPDDNLLVVFDASGVSFRNEIYDQYKANRDEPPEELRPQFKLVRDAVDAFGLPRLELEGFEADDIIATYTKLAREDGRTVRVISSDKDLMQLIADGVVMWDPMKSREIDDEAVRKKFFVGPELVRDVLALAGDTSDNVPGVPGIGPKTAAQLLDEFGSLEALLDKAETIKQPKRRQSLIEFRDQALLSQRLVTLRDDVPVTIALEDLDRPHFDPDQAKAFLRDNDFKSLQGRIDTALGTAGDKAGAAEPKDGEGDYQIVTDLAALDALLAEAAATGWLAIDTETTSLNVAAAQLVGISLSVKAGTGAYIPLAHVDDFHQPLTDQLDREEVFGRLRPVLTDPAILKIGHNLKYDLAVLAKYDVAISPIDDTMLISYVLDGAGHGHSMDELAKLHLDVTTMSYEDVCGKGKSQVTFDRAPIDQAGSYAAEDADITLRLWQLLKPRVPTERMAYVYEMLERPLAPILASMEARGITVDAEILRRLTSDFTQRMAALEDEAKKLAGHDFNLGSPKQLGEILFDELGIEGGKKGKSGAYATGADVLEGLANQGHELPRVILDWRQLQKLTRTYTEALVEEIQESTGRIHTSYAMAATSTGRLSSNDPNLQNIPIRSEEGRKIRTAFVPDDGFLLLSADYSQIELRVLAHMAEIEALKKAFAKDIDIHAVTASEMFDKPVEEIGADLRRSAKTINYGIIYGIGAFGLAQRLGIEHKRAKEFIERYFERYPGIKQYMDRTKAQAREQGFVRTIFGRRCVIPEINNKVVARRAYAERQAINAPIQGSAADVMKRAMIRVARNLRNNGAGARMLLQVHDELVFEVPKDEIDQTKTLVQEQMEAAASLTVPLVVDIGTGANWDAAH